MVLIRKAYILHKLKWNSQSSTLLVKQFAQEQKPCNQMIPYPMFQMKINRIYNRELIRMRSGKQNTCSNISLNSFQCASFSKFDENVKSGREPFRWFPRRFNSSIVCTEKQLSNVWTVKKMSWRLSTKQEKYAHPPTQN